MRIRINETEAFRPGMSVSTEIETRYRTNVLTVPMASVTTRPPKPPEKKDNPGKGTAKSGGTNAASSTPAKTTNGTLSATGTNNLTSDKKSKEDKAIEVVFVADGDHVKMVPVKIGICDNDYWEISEGLTEGQGSCLGRVSRNQQGPGRRQEDQTGHAGQERCQGSKVTMRIGMNYWINGLVNEWIAPLVNLIIHQSDQSIYPMILL